MIDRQAHLPTAPRSRAAQRDGAASFYILVSVAAAVAVAAGGMLIREAGEPVILLLLGVLAVFGAFFLLAASVGLVRIEGAEDPSLAAATYLDAVEDAVELRSAEGGRLHRSRALLALMEDLGLDGRGLLEVDLDRLGCPPEMLYRLVEAERAREPMRASFEVVGGPASRLEVMVAPVSERLIAWKLVLSPAAEPGETAGASSPALGRFLDDLPAGIMSFDEGGRVSLVNRTLIEWMRRPAGMDQGALSLSSLFGRDAAEALLDELRQGAGEAVEAMLAREGAEPLPVLLTLRAPAGSGAEAAAVVLLRAPDSPASDPGEAHERFARLFHSAPIAIATLSRDGRIASANTEFSRLFGRTGRRSGSRPTLAELVSEESRPALLRVLSGEPATPVDSEGSRAHAPIDIMLGDGRASARLFVSRTGAGPEETPERVVYAIDTTKQKELELQFAQSQKMQAVGQLAGGIAHDFNNVLTVIFTACDLLLLRHRPNDPSFPEINAIRSNAGRAAGLVRQLLAFSRRQTLRPEVLSLNEVIGDLNVFLSRLLGEKTKLKTAYGRDLWLVKADVTQFEQVIMNLAVNARDAMPEGGRLTIRTANVGRDEVATLGDKGIEAGDYVLCEVADTGCGMSPEILEKIFEPFFSTKEVGKGTGLGLSTVYGIVKQTGGFIYVDSEPGKGTTFRIYLPRHVRAEEIEAPPQKAERKERTRDLTGTGTVLLVEDEEAVRRFAGLALKRQGFKVLEAGSGIEALEVMQACGGRVDVVVSDIVMPEMDGPTLLKELRKQKPALRIIFMSGYADDALKSLDEGERFAFLPKPFQLKDLVAIVKETLEAE